MRRWIALFAIFGMPSQAATVCGLAHPAECLKDVARDQAGIWTSPARLKPADAAWLVPLADATAFAFHFDRRAENAVGANKSKIQTSSRIANFGSPYATAGGAVGLYFIGIATHNQHVKETGRLGAEAVVDASIVVEALKFATNRQGPDSGPAAANFWPHGVNPFETNTSFPSGHATVSWAMARVVAAEYPKSKPVKIAAYAFATAISVCRVTGRAHFPSDVVVGSALGYLIGGYVTRHHVEVN